jgi:hypothetical protein
MDPYLESPALWPHVHTGLIYTLTAELNRRLPPGYAAVRETRVYLTEATRDVIPDVSVESRKPIQRSPQAGGVATLDPTETEEAATWMITLRLEEIRESYLEIRQVQGIPRVVTAIEVLSPSNKLPGSSGHKIYQDKQANLAQEGIALLEIDLLRGGEHTVAAPRPELVRHGVWDYLACLHRAHDGPTWQIWPLHLRERLPSVRVPLANGDPDVLLPLQPALERMYDEGAFARLIDYSREPEPPLNADHAVWARELLRPLVEGREAARENGSEP